MASKTDGDSEDIDIDNILDADGGEDKEIAAMGVAQTIGTVWTYSLVGTCVYNGCFRLFLLWILRQRFLLRSKKSLSLSLSLRWRSSSWVNLFCCHLFN